MQKGGVFQSGSHTKQKCLEPKKRNDFATQAVGDIKITLGGSCFDSDSRHIIFSLLDASVVDSAGAS